jgi:hypothetical protein
MDPIAKEKKSSSRILEKWGFSKVIRNPNAVHNKIIEERLAIPPLLREMAVETIPDPEDHKSETGAGFIQKFKRRW